MFLFAYNIFKGASMWEITLCGEYADVVYLLEMENTLKDILKKDMLSVVWISEKVFCNLAIINCNNIDCVKRIVLETILKIAKTKYFQENLHLSINDISIFTFLVSSLIMIDLDEEVDYIINYVENMKYIDINSFICFKLNALKNNWSYLINYINKTYCGEYQEGIYLDFLKFLTDLQKPKHDVLYLEKNKNYLELLNKKHEKVKEFPLNDEIGVVVQLILLSPKKIIINCVDLLSDKISSLIDYIFDEKLSYLL